MKYEHGDKIYKDFPTPLILRNDWKMMFCSFIDAIALKIIASTS